MGWDTQEHPVCALYSFLLLLGVTFYTLSQFQTDRATKLLIPCSSDGNRELSRGKGLLPLPFILIPTAILMSRWRGPPAKTGKQTSLFSYLFIHLFNSGLCNIVGWRMPDAAHARAAQVLSWWDAWLCHPPSWDTTLTRLSKEGCSLLGVNNLLGKLLMSHQVWQGRSQSVLVNEASQRKSLLMDELISDPSPITPLRNAGTSFDV